MRNLTIFLIAIIAYLAIFWVPISKDNIRNNLFTLSRFYDLIKGDNFVSYFYWNDLDDNLEKELSTDFDFIIIGAGSAGSVIANRLSENCRWRVLLLEAGREETAITQMAPLAPTLIGSEYDWNFKIQKQANFGMGFDDEINPWAQGKGLGGGSVINYMIYTRGAPADYNRWAQKGWSFTDLLPYFRKFENHFQYDPKYRNQGGELSVTQAESSVFTSYFLEAGKEFGLHYKDHNSGTNLWKIDHIQMALQNGKRHSAASAFLYPVRKRNNLFILRNSLATRILIDHKLKRVYGVQFERNNRKYIVKTKKEVILSAGAANTAKLLKISGIGAKEELQKLGIEPVVDLPGVGQNLKDHLTFIGMTFKLGSDELKFGSFLTNILNPKNLYDYIRYGKGFFTKTSIENVAFIKVDNNSKVENKEDDSLTNYPDIELVFIPISMAWDRGYIQASALAVKNEYYEKLWMPLTGQNTFQICPILLHPNSAGYIRLNESNPTGDPLIYTNHYNDNDADSISDIKKMIKAIRFTQKLILESKTFAPFKPELVRIPVPGCEHADFDSDTYWECALRHLSFTVFHPIGTAKMGKESDKSTVVDEQLKVHGIDNLRVADASIMPNHISGHTSVVCNMIGEKAADLIRNSY